MGNILLAYLRFFIVPGIQRSSAFAFFPFGNVYGLLGTMTELFDFLYNHNMELQKNFVFFRDN